MVAGSLWMGGLLLAAAERRIGLADILHVRMLAIACGRLPDTGRDLCSQPTISRWENAPTLREVIRLTYALVDTWCDSYARPPDAVTLDIDDTVDVVHGHQKLALFNAHHDDAVFYADPC